MLQTMRDNAQGIVAKIIVFFIIFVFALWGVESIVNLGGGEKPLAEVGGKEITEAEVQRTVEQQKANLRRQFGEQFNEDLFNDGMLRQSAIEQLIQRKVELVQAEKMGLHASPQQIDETIVGIPAFQLDGKFNKDQFRSVLAMNGWTPMTFRSSLSEDIVANQLSIAITQSDLAMPFQVRLNGMLDGERRSLSWVEFKASDLIAEVNLTDEEVQAAYDNSKNRYQTPELVSIRYVGLERDAIAATMSVTDEEIQQAYADYLNQLKDKEQRRASHILLEVNDQRDDATTQALAAEIEKRISNGEDFNALAKEFSDDIGTKAKGGELGFASKGAYVEAFDNALYSMNKGEVSAPVKTEYGYHIIKLVDIKGATADTLDAKRPELEQWIRGEKAQQHIAEQTQELTNLAFSASNIDEIAAAMGLKTETSDFFTRDSGEGIAANAEIRAEAFADNLLIDREVSQIVETGNGTYVFVVDAHKEAETLPLAAVRSQVEMLLKREKALDIARERANKVVDGEQTPDNWKAATVSFRQSGDVPREAQQRAFAMAANQKEAVEVSGGVAVIRVDEIAVPEMADLLVSDDQRNQALSRTGRNGMVSFRKWAEENTEIVKPGA